MTPTVFSRKTLSKQLQYANLREISRQCGVGPVTLARIRDQEEVRASALEAVSEFYMRQMRDAA